MSDKAIFHSLCAAAVALALSVEPAAAGGIMLAHSYSEGSPVDVWAREFGECLDRNGGLFVEVVGGGKLGRSGDLADAVSQGNIDVAILPAKALGERWPGLSKLGQSEPIFDPRQMINLSRSSRFLVEVNEIGAKGYGLAVLSVGWQFSVLAGVNRRLDDGALQGARFLVPATVTTKETDLVQNAVRLVGAEPVVLDARDTQQALQFHAVDGAVVDLETARSNMAQHAFDQLQWSSDYAPFSSPIVIVVSTSSYAYQEISAEFEKLFSSDGGSCLAAAGRFNDRAVAEMRDLAAQAQSSGIQVVEVSPVWRAAFSAAVAARREGGEGGESRDAVATAVRNALLD